MSSRTDETHTIFRKDRRILDKVGLCPDVFGKSLFPSNCPKKPDRRMLHYELMGCVYFCAHDSD